MTLYSGPVFAMARDQFHVIAEINKAVLKAVAQARRDASLRDSDDGR